MFVASSSIVFALLLVSSVYCFDQSLKYQDASPLKEKLPMEMLEEFHIRQKRDAPASRNITVKNDTHVYYTSSYSNNKNSDWIELSIHPESKIDDYLSNGNLKLKNFKLKFTFPFYGHPVTNATVTTGGFMYVGYVKTTLIASVMYIAPFMAPFNPALNESGKIYYLSTATQFTVQWTNLHLASNEKAGAFTFQCTLFKDGRIMFAYKLLPQLPSKVLKDKPPGAKHPVRVGISDAFFGYRLYYQNGKWYKVRIFYVYHKVDKVSQISSQGSSLLLRPVKNCIALQSCGECVNLTKTSKFKCAWCSKLKRCSDSLDRHRVEWFQKSCNKKAITKYGNCLSDIKPGKKPGNKGSSKTSVYSSQRKSGISNGAVVAIVVAMLILVITIGLAAWCFYAYTHPVSPSGLFLIELRNKPAQLFKSSGSGASVPGATTSASRA